MEKAQQIAELMLLREEQRRAMAQLQIKDKKIVNAYQAFATQRDRWTVDPSSPQTVFLKRPLPEERECPQYLLSLADLARHVREVADAEQALAQTNGKLAGLGITGLD